MPRFIFLKHDCDEPHWDFMLESGTILRTWKLFAQPEIEKEMAATASFDHRLLYLDYEGPISGNRGTVTRFDSGSFEWIVNEKNRIVISLSGETLTGVANLINNNGEDWDLTINKEKKSLIRS
jgi:DNA polymerase Ligase (LigD)